MHNFNPITVGKFRRWPIVTAHYSPIEFYGNARRLEREILHQLFQTESFRVFAGLAIYLNAQTRIQLDWY